MRIPHKHDNVQTLKLPLIIHPPILNADPFFIAKIVNEFAVSLLLCLPAEIENLDAEGSNPTVASSITLAKRSKRKKNALRLSHHL